LPKRLAGRKITIEDGTIGRTSKKWAGKEFESTAAHTQTLNERKIVSTRLKANFLFFRFS
jgi:hypothetical protein